MKKSIFLGLILAISFSGCLSDDEQKAKEITVKKIIEDDKKEKALKDSLGKKDTRDYSNAFGLEDDKKKKALKDSLGKKDTRDYSNAFGLEKK